MKAHMIYPSALAVLLMVGCGSESTEPATQADVSKAKPQVEPAAAPQPEHSAATTPVANNAPIPAATTPAYPTPKYDIFRSAGNGDIEAVKYHLTNGVKLNAQDKTGKTALLWAIRSKKHEVVYHLLDRGANPNAADQNKVSPLFWAVRMRRPELVTALLNKGADITIKDSRGKDVFHYAKDDTIIEILRSHEKK